MLKKKIMMAAVGILVVLAGCGYIPVEEDRDQFDIQLVKLEDKVTLIIPSDLLFYPGTANFKKYFDSSLRAVINYLEQTHPSAIVVSGYENSSSQAADNLVISKNQIKKVANYIMSNQDVVPLAVNQEPNHIRQIAKFPTAKKNRRIEISYHLNEKTIN